MKPSNSLMMAFDVRGHGKTITANDADLSMETLTKDIIDLTNAAFDGSRPIILCGHSMGGAIVARAAASGVVKRLVAVVVLDVVEGTALESLPYMIQVLKNRPQHFDTIEDAIQWR
jgi:protein phosphatase methylesterase 1